MKSTHKDKQAAWAHYGNLAFYPGFKRTFFYFDWLLENDNYTKRSGQYIKEAQRIGQEAKASLQEGNFLSTDYNDISEITKRFGKLFDVITKAVDYERQNERAYFKQKYQEVIKGFKEEDWKNNVEIKQLASILSDAMNGDEFNYGEFMSLINLLLQGTENAKAIIQYETKHLKEIQNGIDALKDARKKQIEGLAASGKLKSGFKTSENGEKIARTTMEVIEESEKRLDRQLKVSYLEQGNYLNVRGAKTHFKNVLSSDVKIAHWITSRIKKLWKDENFRSTIKTYIIENDIIPANKYSLIEARITRYIIDYVQEEAIKHIPKILNEQYNRYKSSDLIKKFDITKVIDLRSNYAIEGYYENYAQYGERIKFFSDLEELTDITDASGANLFKALNDLIKRCNTNKRKKKCNDKDDQFMLDIVQEMEFKKEFDDIRSLINNLTTVRNQYDIAKKRQEAYFTKHTDGWQKEITDSKGKKITISLTLKDGKPVLEGIEQLQELQGYQTLMGNKKINTDSLSRIIATLKTKANDHVKEMLLNVIKNNQNTFQNDLITRIRNSLEHLEVSVGGPKFSELLTGIQFSSSGGDLSIQWTGGKNSKNDVVVMTIKTPDNTVFSSIEKDFNESINTTLINNFDDDLSNIKNLYINEFTSIFQETAGKLQLAGTTKEAKNESLHKYKILKNAFFQNLKNQQDQYNKIKEKHTQVDRALDEYIENLPNISVDDRKSINKERSRLQKELLNSLKDSFFVSTTVKTYNQYDNNLGFHGGSLGATPKEQLTRLADIFESANIPLNKSDFNWLLGAITNCSPFSVIGEHDKHSIEHYLGAMAAFALFDEGAAEATLVKMEEDVRDTYTVPSILHLYKVNGIFVPGSYVLQEVKNELETCINQLNFATESLYRGAGVTIINKVTYKDLPNFKSKGKNLDTHPWETMASIASKKVRIQILFLANLMDIMHNINTAMGNIELPQ